MRRLPFGLDERRSFFCLALNYCEPFLSNPNYTTFWSKSQYILLACFKSTLHVVVLNYYFFSFNKELLLNGKGV